MRSYFPQLNLNDWSCDLLTIRSNFDEVLAGWQFGNIQQADLLLQGDFDRDPLPQIVPNHDLGLLVLLRQTDSNGTVGGVRMNMDICFKFIFPRHCIAVDGGSDGIGEIPRIHAPVLPRPTTAGFPIVQVKGVGSRLVAIDAVHLGADHRRVSYSRVGHWQGQWLSP